MNVENLINLIKERNFKRGRYRYSKWYFDIFCQPKHQVFQYLEHFSYLGPNSPSKKINEIYLLDDNELFNQLSPLKTQKETFKVSPFIGTVASYSSYGNCKIYFYSGLIYVEHETCIFILCPESFQNPERILLRLIREVLYRTLENESYVSLHGSACLFEGNTIAFIGDKGAGKTSSMMHMLQMGADYISNDRLLVGKGWACETIPLPIRISKKSLGTYPIMNSFVSGSSNTRLSRYYYAESELEKLELTPKELTEVGRVKPISGTELKGIFIPQIRQGHSQISHEIPPKEYIFNTLMNNKFTPHDESWTEPWITRRELEDGVLEKQGISVCKKLAQEIPISIIRFGYNSFSEQFSSYIARLIQCPS